MINKLKFLYSFIPHYIAILFLLFFTSQFAQADIHLRFGVYTTDQPTAMVKAYRPILNRLEEDLSIQAGQPVEISLKVSSTYEKGIDALVNGEVDFSKLGPASYVSAYQKNPGLRILALDSKDGSKTFNGVICVHEDSDLESISQLQGRTFAFGNEQSTIGRYLSQAFLHKNGITSNSLSNYTYLERHDRVGYAVSQRTYDAGALKEGTFKKLVKAGAKIKVLATFENVNKPWVASSNMDPRIFDMLRKTMLELEAPSVFKHFNRKQFLAGSDLDFEVIRNAILRNTDFFSQSNAPESLAIIDVP